MENPTKYGKKRSTCPPDFKTAKKNAGIGAIKSGTNIPILALRFVMISLLS